jgi:3-oxoacyl-[acyl-carrier-protein] synthase II
MSNIAAAQLSIAYGIMGPSFSLGTACSSGGDTITFAAMLLETGMADTVIAMAGDAALSALTIWSLFKTGALSRAGQSRPFDKSRDGFVIGEGGGALVLETEEHALRRGADIKAELCGCANNTDGYHPVAPRPDGSGAAECIRIALGQAGLRPEDIGYVNAHGTATVKGDAAETMAIKSVFGDYDLPVSSTKGATGHMMGAGGITEVIACINAIETGMLPPNLGFADKDAECALNIIQNSPINSQIDYAMSNALGFGGQNSSIIVGRYGR